jgi:hypothetical protein
MLINKAKLEAHPRINEFYLELFEELIEKLYFIFKNKI